MSFTDESGKLPVLRRLSLEELPAWLAAQPRPYARLQWFVWHHTLEPTERSWRGKSTLQGIFDYYRDSRGFPYGHGPQFWIAPDGIWIGHHPSTRNRVGATGWNAATLHMEVIHNGDLAPFSAEQMAIAAEVCVIVCRWAGIPLQWVEVVGGGAQKSRPGITMHRQLYIDGRPPKTCPGVKVTQAAIWAAIQAAANQSPQEDDMFSDKDRTLLEKVATGVEALQRSAAASSYRESIDIALEFGRSDVADALYKAAVAKGYSVPGYQKE